MSTPTTSGAELVLGTADVVKLIVPFIAAILLVWIKQWVEGRIARRRKQRALWRLIVDELQSTHGTGLAFKAIGRAAQAGRLHLVGLTTPKTLSTLSCELTDLDPANAFVYADLDAWLAIVDGGLERLAALQMSRVSAANDLVAKLDRVIFGQARVAASDAVSLAEAALAVLDVIPLGNHEPLPDGVSLASLERAAREARRALDDWSRFDVAIGADATATAIDRRVAPTSVPHPPLLPKPQSGYDEYLEGG